MTWHKTSHHIASNDVTITWPDPATDTKTSKHFTSKHKTSPPWNGRRLVHSKEMIWASRWSVALRTFYRQMLSVLYYIVLFLLETSAPGLSGHYRYTYIQMIALFLSTLWQWHFRSLKATDCCFGWYYDRKKVWKKASFLRMKAGWKTHGKLGQWRMWPFFILFSWVGGWLVSSNIPKAFPK